jgi:integrase
MNLWSGIVGKLTARKVETASFGKHGDGDGLQLAVAKTGTKAWVLRFMLNLRAREMGLGSYPLVSLAQAREKAAKARALAKSGIDPIEAQKTGNEIPTFGVFADSLVSALSAGFRNEKHKAQWKMTLEIYAAPLRPRRIDQIGTDDVLEVLRPIWQAKPETASRTRGRIEKVLSAAKSKGFRSGENPAQWRGHLENLLPKPSKLTRGHHAAMPYADLPTFMPLLQKREATAALALEFAILTAARSGEVYGAVWSEFDLAEKVWTLAAARMKAGREHRVPLSERAVEIVSRLAEAKQGRFVFPGRTDKPLSGMAMQMLLRRMGANVTAHGFRSSFRDWVGNETHFPREVAEAALSHVIGDKAEQA